MTFETLLYEIQDDVAVVTLNRPERLNAWTWTMARELVEAIEKANDDKAVGAIVVTGAGRAFCAGADIADNLKARLDAYEQGEKKGFISQYDLPALMRRSKPLIAAVNGVSVGVGFTFILPFDIIIASEKAKFGAFFIKLGVVPELDSTHFLVQRIGFGRASEMFLTGRLYDAAEVHAMGLTNRLVAPEELMRTSMDLAHQIAANPERQLRLIKGLITKNGSCDDLDLVRKRELDLFLECTAMPEHKEAVSAFLEKRPAKFR